MHVPQVLMLTAQASTRTTTLSLMSARQRRWLWTFGGKKQKAYHSFKIIAVKWRRWTVSGILVSILLRTWPGPNTLVGKAWQRLYNLGCLRDFRLPHQTLKNFYTSTTKGVLTGSITAWYRNSTHKALQRVARPAEEASPGAHFTTFRAFTPRDVGPKPRKSSETPITTTIASSVL